VTATVTTSTAPAGSSPVRPGKRRRPAGSRARSVSFWVTIVVLGFIFIAPLVYMLLTSFKTANEATSASLRWFPKQWSTHGYDALTASTAQTPVLRWFVNSMIAAVCNAALVVSTSALAAYALARMDFPGKKVFTAVVLSTLFIPAFVLLIPNYLIVNKLNWVDSLFAVIVPSAAGAFGVFFMRQFYAALPSELEEAGRVDGANTWQIFTRLVLPLARPGLATLTVLAFLTNWNDFLWPVYVLISSDKLTLPAGLGILQGASVIDYPIIMAGAVIASVPVLILFTAVQRHVIESVARSGLKG
jgi:multiple sugar transport system permease protein